MAAPRVFIASTCYDLKYIRGNVQFFLRNLGYDPVMSESGDVFYDPEAHTHDSCISEVSSCQLFVLIIGGRYGGTFKTTDKSITNAEYSEAIRCRIPVFTLVEQAVYAEHYVYVENSRNSAIVYPSVKNTKIFDFIDEVRKASFNNAIHPFNDFADIESYLRKQWAGLLFSFLSQRAAESRVLDLMSRISDMSQRIEFLSQQILKSVGTEEAKLTVSLYNMMLGHESVRMLLGTRHRPTPLDIMKHATLAECAAAIGRPLVPVTETDFTWSSSGEVEVRSLKNLEADYLRMREELGLAVEKSGHTVEGLAKAVGDDNKSPG
jgi:hypothetical protein